MAEHINPNDKMTVRFGHSMFYNNQYIYISCLLYMYVLNSTIGVQFMANHMFTAEIKGLERKLNDAYDTLMDLLPEISEHFGEAAPCTSSCETVMDHLENTIKSLAFLDRIIPRSYTPESYDHRASKLENRINRLERLMKK